MSACSYNLRIPHCCYTLCRVRVQSEFKYYKQAREVHMQVLKSYALLAQVCTVLHNEQEVQYN